MTKRTERLLLAALAGTMIAGCSNKADDSGNTQMTMVQRQEDLLGNGFGTAFRAGENTDPVDPRDGDVVPVNLGNEPVALK